MVRRIFLGLAAAAVMVALGTCALFTDSLFPWYLSGVTNTLDLSRWIDSTLVPEEMSVNDWWLDLAVLRDDSGTDYVFVSVFGYQHTRLIILNADLTVVTAPNPNPIDDFELGRRALVDANDDFVVGPQIFDNPSLAPGASISGGWDDPGLSIGTQNYLFGVDNGVSPALLNYQPFGSNWSSLPGGGSVPVSTNTEDRWELAAVTYDEGRPAGQRVVLLLRNWARDDEARIVYLSEVDLQNGAIASPVNSYPGFSVNPRGGIERMHYTRKGILVRDYDSRATLYRFSEDDSTSLNQGTRHYVIDAYDIDGEYFYVVDKDERMIYRGRTGW